MARLPTTQVPDPEKVDGAPVVPLNSTFTRLTADGRLQVINETDGTWITVRGRNDPDGDREIYPGDDV